MHILQNQTQFFMDVVISPVVLKPIELEQGFDIFQFHPSIGNDERLF